MDLEGTLTVVLFILHWRVTVCLIGSIVSAIVLVNTFPWLTGLQGIVIAALGIFPGAVWEAQEATPQSAKTEKSPETTAFVAGASSVIIGASWGVFSSTSSHSFFAGVVIFALAAWGWSWYAKDLNHLVSKQRAQMCIALASFAYPIAALVAHNVL